MEYRNKLKQKNKMESYRLDEERINKAIEDDIKENYKINEHKKKIRKELLNNLNNQILSKNERPKSSIYSDYDLDDKNIFREKKGTDQYGRCMKCEKLIKKQMLCPSQEYENVHTIELEKKKKIQKRIY